MVDAARAGGRAIPELWPLGTEALALAMEVSVLEAKRLGHRAVLRLSWLLLVASVALSTLLQVAVAPPTLVGYLTAGATPVWLLGSFAVLSLLYRTPAPAADPAADRGPGAGRRGASKRERARQAYAALVAAGQPVTGARLAEAADISASYGRALLAEFQADPTLAAGRPTGSGPARRWGSDDRDHLADLPQLLRQLRAARRPGPQARLLLAGLPAGRLPRPPTHQRRPAAAPAARTGAPSATSSAASAPAPSGPAPASATTSARTSSASSAGRRQEAPTATGPAPPAATTWRASGASSPPCCARPPPPASRTRRPPAGRRPRPCASSTACSRDQPIVTPPVRPAWAGGACWSDRHPANQRRAQRNVTRWPGVSYGSSRASVG